MAMPMSADKASRERFEQWADTQNYAKYSPREIFMWMFEAWQAAERETRERCAQIADAATELVAAEIMVGAHRCPICRFPLSDRREKGCVIGDCSMRGGDSGQVRDRDHNRARLKEIAGIIKRGVAEAIRREGT